MVLEYRFLVTLAPHLMNIVKPLYVSYAYCITILIEGSPNQV